MTRRVAIAVLILSCAAACGLFRATESVEFADGGNNQGDAGVDRDTADSSAADVSHADTMDGRDVGSDMAAETCAANCGARAKCIDGECVCEPFSTMVDGKCIDHDPCATGTCIYVDNTTGDDTNPYSPDSVCSVSIDEMVSPIPWAGYDIDSGCGDVDGVDLPADPPASLTLDRALFDRLTPSQDWEGCALGDSSVGSFHCDGVRTGTFRPLAGIPENGGLGWPGDALTRFHYPGI